MEQAGHDARRVAATIGYDARDVSLTGAFGGLASLVAVACDAPVALVMLLDDDGAWIAASHGMSASVSALPVSFGRHVVSDPARMLEVDDIASDARFVGETLPTSETSLRFCAGVPLVSDDGWTLGALCVMDYVPRTLRDTERASLRLGARYLVSLLETRRATRRLEFTLGERRQLVSDNREPSSNAYALASKK